MSALTTLLSPLEIRVLGVLAEKQRTVPDSYPLTLNSLLAGCNQKTSRQPIMELSEAQAQLALESLKRYSLVTETSGGRAYRYGHNIDGVLRIPSQSIALLTALMLRGPQTAGELRIACDRMHNFADISSVEAFLDEMAERPAGALVVKLARLPGAREQRWAHLLGDAPSVQDAAPSTALDAVSPGPADVTLDEVATLKARVSRLEQDLAATRAALQRVCAELGMPKDLWPEGTSS
ncbi:YceH family protein [Variovorax soli]|uniref:YceH family protein n=1 Tax=Variovorax soli TaxID=376815 RepID=UPI0008391F76|nr:YceH family protein [Variovorax soli]